MFRKYIVQYAFLPVTKDVTPLYLYMYMTMNDLFFLESWRAYGEG